VYNGAVGVRSVSLDDFHHPRSDKTFQRFGRGVGHALLSCVERLPNVPRTSGGMAQRPAFGRRLARIETARLEKFPTNVLI
jgi:hypothetical protein